MTSQTIGADLYNFVKRLYPIPRSLTCDGDDRTYFYLPSRWGNTLADREALCELSTVSCSKCSFLDHGSGKCQYCSPSAVVMRDTMNFLAYADGHHDLLEISDIIKVPLVQLLDLIPPLLDLEGIEVVG